MFGGIGSVGFGGGRRFLPTSIANLDLWLDAAVGVTEVSSTIPDIQAWAVDTGMASITAGQSDPIGGSNAAKLTENAANSVHTTYAYPNGTDDVKGDRIVTFWAKASGRDWLHIFSFAIGDVWVNTNTGVVGTITPASGVAVGVTSSNVGAGWWKFVVTARRAGAMIWTNGYLRLYLATGDGASDTYAGNGTSGVYVYTSTGMLQTRGVSAWANQSGSADANRNAVQATKAAQPSRTLAHAAFNNLPTIRFEAGFATMYLRSGTWSVAPAAGSLFVVGKSSGLSVWFDSTTANRWLLDVTGGGAGSYNVEGYLSAFTLAMFGKAVDSPCILGVDFISGSSASAIYFSAVTPAATGSPGTWGGAPGYTLGATYVNTSAMEGDIAEVLAYGRALNATERRAVMGYLANKYMLSLGA